MRVNIQSNSSTIVLAPGLVVRGCSYSTKNGLEWIGAPGTAENVCEGNLTAVARCDARSVLPSGIVSRANKLRGSSFIPAHGNLMGVRTIKTTSNRFFATVDPTYESQLSYQPSQHQHGPRRLLVFLPANSERFLRYVE